MNFTNKVFTWDLANNDNICKEVYSVNQINNTINSNNTISTLLGQSNEKALQLTERHVAPQNWKITPRSSM